jgi:hypothetical protein
MAVEKFRKHPECGRTMHFLELDSVEDWPEKLALGKSKHFVLFLALSAEELDDDDVEALAKRCFEQGMVYLSVWGNDSERVHDLFEEAAAEHDPDADADTVLLSEWHDEEPLSQAVLYAVSSAYPAAAYEKTCGATLVVVVGNPDAADQVRGWLKAPSRLASAAEDREDALGLVAAADDDEEEEKEDLDEDEEDEDGDEDPDEDENDEDDADADADDEG